METSSLVEPASAPANGVGINEGDKVVDIHSIPSSCGSVDTGGTRVLSKARRKSGGKGSEPVCLDAMKIEEVLSTRVFANDDHLCRVVIGHVTPKNASRCLARLAELLPLASFNLEHLKRIRRTLDTGNKSTEKSTNLDIVVCPESYFTHIGADVKAELEDGFDVKNVPKYAPQTTAGNMCSTYVRDQKDVL
jgi:hypothetical protein